MSFIYQPVYARLPVCASTLAQSVLDAFGNYSTSEVETPFKWVDGKTIYKKTVNLGALPNNTTKTVAHGVSGISNVIDIEAAAYTGSEWVGLPYTANPVTNNVTITVSSSDIRLQSWANRSAWTGFATLFYTKT